MKYFYTLSLLFTIWATNAQIVNIPDASFKAKLLEASMDNSIAKDLNGDYFKIDTNDDGEIQETEAFEVSKLDLFSTDIVSLEGVEYFSNLIELECQYGELASFELVGLTNLEKLSLHDNNLTAVDISDLVNLVELRIHNNQLMVLNLSGLTSLVELYCGGNNIENLDLSEQNVLNYLTCKDNSLTNLTVFSDSLESLNCDINMIETIDLSNVPNLRDFRCAANQLTILDLSNNPNLELVNCFTNQLESIDLSNSVALESLSSSTNNLTALDLSYSPNLDFLSCSENQLVSINVSNNPLLEKFFCNENNLESIDVSNNALLDQFWIDENLITELDVSYNTNLYDLDCSLNTSLIWVNLKDGQDPEDTYFLNCQGNTALNFICVDDGEAPKVLDYLESIGLSVNVNTYCSFNPGGDYNTITGQVIYDMDENGCDMNDNFNPYLKVNIADVNEIGSTFTDDDGQYTFYTGAGNFALEVALSSSFFSIDPITAFVPFANNNNNTTIQDFCITPIGVQPDVSVVIAPTVPARPGFEAEYVVTFNNNGNQIMSGQVEFSFDADLLNFVSTSLTPQGITDSSLIWDYSDFMPLESRQITVILSVNSPTDTPPVNIDDILVFEAIISPLVDEIPINNTFTLNQIVVGSFDPNNIICLEGDIEPVSNIGEELHYNINFENTGTYPAENVVVKLEINPDEFDISSLGILGSSHDVYAKITFDTLELVFEDINLEYGGHGNILMMVATIDSLQENSIVGNSCDIFFDYNFPVPTNDASTLFQDVVRNHNVVFDQSISISPNPASDFISISASSNIISISFYDNLGRLIRHIIHPKGIKSIDIEGLSKGIYFANVTTLNGIKTIKIIKE